MFGGKEVEDSRGRPRTLQDVIRLVAYVVVVPRARFLECSPVVGNCPTVPLDIPAVKGSEASLGNSPASGTRAAREFRKWFCDAVGLPSSTVSPLDGEGSEFNSLWELLSAGESLPEADEIADTRVPIGFRQAQLLN